MKHLPALALAVATPLMLRAADTSLLDALRRDDVATVRTLLASGADPNVRDASGASALMYATHYASAREMRLLLDKGADPNTANAYGSTALMWAAGEANKLELLLERGAAVNATGAKGVTALLAAAYHGNAEGIRLLVSRGADAHHALDMGIGLQSLASFRTDDAIESVIAAARLTLTLPARRADSPLANTLHNPRVFRRFLDLGADPNERIPLVTRELPAMSLAAFANTLESLQQLVTRGADVKVKDNYGTTPLMMAAGATHPDPVTVKFLIAQRLDLNAQDNAGRTALDWALLQGETAVVPVLRAAGATPGAAVAPPPPSVQSPRAAREAIELALKKLQPSGPPFHARHRCISCHHQSLPALAAAVAGRRSVPLDRALVAHPTDATLAMWAPAREELLLGNIHAVPGFVANVTYALLAFDEEGVVQSPVTDAVTFALGGAQNRDGSWLITDVRPPLLDNSAVSLTALAIRALDKYAPVGRRLEARERILRAADFLRRAQPASSQDAAFRLLGLVWAGGTRAEVSRLTKRLLTLQRRDGGWGQVPSMASDAYATGQALYALHAAGTSPASVAYQRGTQFLLRTQLDDGTWFVRSRAFGFQPYFDAGFPHGRDQFISAAATSWAAIALAYTI